MSCSFPPPLMSCYVLVIAGVVLVGVVAGLVLVDVLAGIVLVAVLRRMRTRRGMNSRRNWGRNGRERQRRRKTGKGGNLRREC